MPGSFGQQFAQHLAGGAVAVVPDDLELAVAAIPVLQQPRDIFRRDVDLLVAALGFGTTSPAAAMRPSSRIWPPKNGFLPSIILKPL